MRGERCMLPYWMLFTGGSSPHERRTLPNSFLEGTPQRFIPACAGNAYSFMVLIAIGAVHPRMRGERTSKRQASLTCIGSSPHARGTRNRVHEIVVLSRFIPACAGNA